MQWREALPMQTLLTPLLSGGKRLGKASFASSDDYCGDEYDDYDDDDCEILEK